MVSISLTSALWHRGRAIRKGEQSWAFSTYEAEGRSWGPELRPPVIYFCFEAASDHESSICISSKPLNSLHARCVVHWERESGCGRCRDFQFGFKFRGCDITKEELPKLSKLRNKILTAIERSARRQIVGYGRGIGLIMGKRNSLISEWDTGVSVIGAFKVDHLQPVELILFQNISTFLTSIQGSPIIY